MRKGYVTVFFSLVITLCFSLFIGMIYGARENAIRLKTMEAMEISMRSGFGEYQKDLWDKYNLLFVDASYGYKVDSMIIPCEHMISCLNENFREEGLALLGGRDLLKLSATDVDVEKVRFATDNNGQAVKNQAVQCMKYRYGTEYLELLYDYVSDYESVMLEAENYETYKEELPPEAYEEPEIKDWVEKAEEISLKEKDVSLLSTLRLVINDISEISSKTVDEGSLLSKRERNKGNYSSEQKDTLLDKMYLTEYLLAYLGDYTDVYTDSVLDYELEYLVSGKTADSSNLETVVNRILLIREAANLISLYSDEERMALIRGLCETFAILLLNPELEKVFEILVVTVISGVESVKDVKVLLKGEKIPLMKEAEDWDTSMENVFGKEEPADSGKGLSYEDYLRIFIYLEEEQILMERFMNICEINVRNQMENKEFRLDFCFDAWSVTAYMQSEYGYSYRLTREYDIEKK